MALDVDIPDPPPLSGPQPHGEYEAIDMTDQSVEDDYRRAEIEAVLADGAWQAAFEEWTEQTGVTEAEFDTVLDRHLIESFDFYWDPAADEVGYRAPTIEGIENSDEIEAELDSLGRIVSEHLETDYLVRDGDEFGFFADGDTGEERSDDA